jgi:4-amino-4-deoxy-L-arabinose transferase-like glycosyltransferase
MYTYLTRRPELIFFALVAFALFFALSGFLIRPALWFDEGITLEIARNYAFYGHLDVLTAPHVFSNLGYLVGTNGYPLTLPLAVAFKVFGYGLVQARIVMLLWMVATLTATYWVTKKLFGVVSALCATALMATFATFYADGLTATGEMPALFFFMIGMWFLLGKKDYFWMGIFWGLAMAAKPGVFILLAHTTVLYILLFDRRGWFRKLFIAGFGFLIPVILWVLFQFPLNLETFYSIVAYVLNPVDIPIISSWVHNLPVHTYENLVISPTANATNSVMANLGLFVTSSTLIYFVLLGTIAAAGLYLGKKKDEVKRCALGLLSIYGLLVVVFFVRGPGWFRYLFGLQILILILLAPALQEVLILLRSKFSELRILKSVCDWEVPALIGVLCLFQVFQLFFLSDIKRSVRPLEAIAYVQNLMEEYPNSTVGIYNIPVLAAFTDPERTYHSSSPQDGYTPLGASPLLASSTPDIVVVTEIGQLIGDKEKEVLKMSYTLAEDASLPSYDVYIKNKVLK